jgi:hypothetical protein
MKSFLELQAFFHEDVRQAVVISLKRTKLTIPLLILLELTMAVNAAYPLPKPWVKGLPEKDQPLPEPTRQFVDTVMGSYLNTISVDDDKEIVGSVCECISDIVKLLGPAAIERRTSM